jgi:hypothetical protein
VRWSFCGKDAGSVESGALDATEDAARGTNGVRERHNRRFAKAS